MVEVHTDRGREVLEVVFDGRLRRLSAQRDWDLVSGEESPEEAQEQTPGSPRWHPQGDRLLERWQSGAVSPPALFDLHAEAERWAGWAGTDRLISLDSLRGVESAWRETHKHEIESDSAPLNHYRLGAELDRILEPGTVVIGDGGDVVAAVSRVLRVHRPGHWLDPGPFGCLGVGPSFAMAAKLAKPDKQVLVVYGDGSFGLNAMEYESAIRQEIPFVGIIGNDGAWGQIKVAQEMLYGAGNAPASELDPEAPYHRMVEGLGGYGEKVTSPAEIGPALRRAFDAGVPACLNVMVDASLMKRASYLG